MDSTSTSNGSSHLTPATAAQLEEVRQTKNAGIQEFLSVNNRIQALVDTAGTIYVVEGTGRSFLQLLLQLKKYVDQSLSLGNTPRAFSIPRVQYEKLREQKNNEDGEKKVAHPKNSATRVEGTPQQLLNEFVQQACEEGASDIYMDIRGRATRKRMRAPLSASNALVRSAS